MQHQKVQCQADWSVSLILCDVGHPILQDSWLQLWFKNWQHLRKHKLTASTFGMAVGFWPRGRLRFCLEKLGLIEPLSGNLATCWSNIKEVEALERYKLMTGNPISFPEFQTHGKKNPEDNWFAASPDGVVDSYIYCLPLHGVLEIKCLFFGGDMTRAYPWNECHFIKWKHVQPAKERCDTSVIANPLCRIKSIQASSEARIMQLHCA